ncbi:MAG: hypothetical protein ASARMPRED_003435 [Alectoria sarmentosa]|nr:MAG: hypothetical protein ASARMPRED_003435 [Alectoria sarmentosa]
MKRSMAGPQGQGNSSNKRPRIRTEDDFQQAFARILDVPDFPAEPPRLAAAPESLVRVPTLEAEKEIERLLGFNTQARPLFANGRNIRKTSVLPKEFAAELKRKYQRGEFDAKVLDYYSDILPRGDSTNVPGQGGRALLLKTIMGQDDTMPSALVAGPTWRPVRPLGKGGFGEVMLWEKARKNGPVSGPCARSRARSEAKQPIRIATKESRPHDFFKVVEWAYIAEKFWRNEMGKISKSEPRHRICYEFADYGDFWDVISWYHKQRLILPEAFLWHVFHSMANALCYCCYGTNNPSSHKRGWDGIVHMDIKGENMLLAAPDPDTHRLYPCVKLADFGLAHTIGVSVAEIRHFKSAGPSGGTEGYMAPEVIDRTPEMQRRGRHPHELIGPHSDIYSLGKSLQNGTDLLELHHEVRKHFEATTPHRFPPGPAPRLDMVYSTSLWNLLHRCLNEDARYRPKLHYLHAETKLGMETFRARAQAEEADASAQGVPACFHSNVLFRRADRKRFETDAAFRSNYRRANLRPVWEILGPLPPRIVAPVGPYVDDQFVDVNFADVAGVEVGTGRQRGGLPALAEREREKKSKEKRRRAARVQQGIRGLLSKMNFFS